MRGFHSIWILLIIAWCGVGGTGCSSAFYGLSNTWGDDLYETHDRSAIAHQKQAIAEAEKAQAEAEKALWEARLAEAEAQLAMQEAGQYTYDSVLADTYESAYARRLRGFESPTYNLPSSYYDLRYSPAYHYVTAYDPMHYNIVVMGDQVWVEPKYISSMFGTWGAPSLAFGFGSGGWYTGFYYDWYWPYGYSWYGYPHYSWYDWWWGYPYYGPGYWPGYWPGYYPGYWPGYYPPGPG
ncbi:MAG: hypothetical protein IJX56_00935, partial [Alistipes sp.]|nr:hypothetical protein [Alistipes sp.]